jgi:hypothetical protein
MNKIKLFDEFNNNEIDSKCTMYGIENYTINEDGSIDVDDNVMILGCIFEKLPIKFNKVSGNFYCCNGDLISLDGCPEEVGGVFDCSGNMLKSLIGSPKIVGVTFDCSYNDLITLDGCSTKIGGNLICDNNPVYNIWKLINDKEYLEIFLDYDMIEGNNLYLARLNDIRSMMGKSPVTKVYGYNSI